MNQTRRGLLASVATGAAAIAGCAAPRSADSEGSESPYTRVYNEVLPSVVVVHVADNGRKVGQGSGFAIDPQTIVTNHHVVDPGATVTVRLADGEWADASIVGSDRHSDLAVLDGVALLAEFVAEVPHRAEHQRQLVGMVGLPTGELAGFDHEDSRGCAVGRQRTEPREAIAQDEDGHACTRARANIVVMRAEGPPETARESRRRRPTADCLRDLRSLSVHGGRSVFAGQVAIFGWMGRCHPAPELGSAEASVMPLASLPRVQHRQGGGHRE